MSMSKPFYIGSLLGFLPVIAIAVSANTPQVVPFYVVYLICVHCHFWYSAWSAIQDGNARTSPGKAVWGMFIPFFNIYWAFHMVGGFPEDYNAYLERHGLDHPKVDDTPFVIFPILVLCAIIPFLGVLAFAANMMFVVPMIISRTCDGVNKLDSQMATSLSRAVDPIPMAVNQEKYDV